MAKIEDCPGFETFGADVKAARKAKQLSRSALADMIHCDSRYLANIENEGTLPSLPVVIQLIKICGLPVERYFNPELMREESAERQRVSHKLQLCPALDARAAQAPRMGGTGKKAGTGGERMDGRRGRGHALFHRPGRGLHHDGLPRAAAGLAEITAAI